MTRSAQGTDMNSPANITVEDLGGTQEQEVQASSTTHKSGVTSSVEERALELLGAGIAANQVAAALGVTEGRISHLLSDETFANQVATLRYEKLQKHNVRDASYDRLEDKMIVQLEQKLPLMLLKPETLLKGIQIINAAKRRGQSAPDQVVNQQNIVNITMPNVIVQKFTTNVNNQVVKAGDQDLVTIQSSRLLKDVQQKREAIEHEPEQIQEE